MRDDAGAAGRANGPRRAGARVLVAEAVAVIALDLAQTLREFGYAVLGPVASVADALALLGRERPDAALLELDLRDGHAAPLAEALARLGVPFALVTAHDGGGHDGPALAGAARVTKPYGRVELRLTLARLLGAGSGTPEPAGTRATAGNGERGILARVPAVPDDAPGDPRANGGAGSRPPRPEAGPRFA
jgi:two-component system, response regulator PdtaR